MTTTTEMLARTLRNAQTATSTAQFTAIITNSLNHEELGALVQIESDATRLIKGLPSDKVFPLMTGIGRAVTDSAHRTVDTLTAGAESTQERAQAYLNIMDRNPTGYTAIGLREAGAEHATLMDAELAEAAETKLDNLMYEVHGDNWFTIMDTPLDQAIAAPDGNTIYRDALRAEVDKL